MCGYGAEVYYRGRGEACFGFQTRKSCLQDERERRGVVATAVAQGMERPDGGAVQGADFPASAARGIREALRERAWAAGAAAWARIERHMAGAPAAPAAAPGACAEEDAPACADDEDAAFWQRFRGQLDEAKQNLPRGAGAVAVLAAPEAMPDAEFMHAARMPPLRALRARPGEPSDTPAARPGGYGAVVFVSPTNVAEAMECVWPGVDSTTPQQGKAAESRMRAATGSKRPGRGKNGDATSTKHTTPATVQGGGKRRRARTGTGSAEASGASYSTPSKKTKCGGSTLFSPGQEAAQSLLALRHAAF